MEFRSKKSPLLEPVIEGAPDIKIELDISDVMFLQSCLNTCRVLFHHVRVGAPPFLVPREGIRVNEPNVTSVAINIRHANVLRGPRVNHHVPGVTIEAVSPVIVTLSKERTDEVIYNLS